MEDTKKNEHYKALSIISITIGSLALITSWIPFINNASAVLAIFSLILGVIALFLNLKNKKILSLIGVGISALSIFIVLTTQATYSSVIKHATDSTSTGTVSTTKDDDSSAKSKKDSITVDYDDYDVKSTKNYKLSYSNNDWSAANVKIDSAKVYKLSKTYTMKRVSDGNLNVNGFIEIHMTVAPQKDISIYPAQATGIFNNGEQHEASSNTSWDGDIAKNAEKSGSIIIPITNLENDSSISSLRLKFNSYYETNDDDDENSDHDYDFTLNLNN